MNPTEARNASATATRDELLSARELAGLGDVTRILSAIEQSGPQAARQLLPLVYDEVRRLAIVRMGHERSGQRRDPTALTV